MSLTAASPIPIGLTIDQDESPSVERRTAPWASSAKAVSLVAHHTRTMSLPVGLGFCQNQPALANEARTQSNVRQVRIRKDSSYLVTTTLRIANG
jgi:hypothetical protein